MNFSISVDDQMLLFGLRGVAVDTERAIRPVAPAISDIVRSGVRAQYNSAGRRGPTGKAWTRKQSTIDRYTSMNARGFGGKVLNEPMRRTDRLHISETVRGAAHGIEIIEDNAITMGTDLRYGAIHQARGQKQYDLTDGDLDEIIRAARRGLALKWVDRGFDVQEVGALGF